MLSSNNTPPSSQSPLSDSTFTDAQWANFWASLLLRYQTPGQSQSHVSSTAIPPSGPAPFNMAIGVAEFALDLLAILPNGYFLYLLLARRDLHNNLRVLLGSFSLCLILIAITRIPTQANYLCTGILYIHTFRWLVFGHEIGVMFFRTVIVPLTIERVLATIRSKNYEQQQSPLIGVMAVLLTLVLSTAIGIYIGHELNESRIENGVISFRGDLYGLYHVVDVSIRLLIWMVCFCVFVTLLQYNQRCYAFARLPNKHTLVQRYQFAENVRTSRLLLVVGTIVFVCNLHFDFVMLRIAYDKDAFDVEYSQSFDLVLALALNAIPLAAIRFHPSMLSVARGHIRQLAHLFLAKCCCIHVSTRPTGEEPESPSFVCAGDSSHQRRIIQKSPRALLTGQKLIVRRDEEQDVYFEELRKSWTIAELAARKGRRSTGQGQYLLIY